MVFNESLFLMVWGLAENERMRDMDTFFLQKWGKKERKKKKMELNKLEIFNRLYN